MSFFILFSLSSPFLFSFLSFFFFFLPFFFLFRSFLFFSLLSCLSYVSFTFFSTFLFSLFSISRSLLYLLSFIFFLACFSSPCSQVLTLLKHADKRGLCDAAGHHVYVRYLCKSSLSLNMQYSKAEKVFEQRLLNLVVNYSNQTNR